MNEARSIKQNAFTNALPNFRNLGVTLRILLMVICLALLQALLLADSWGDVLLRMAQIATLLAPLLLVSLLLLWAVQPWLHRLSYVHGVVAINVLVAVLTLLIHHLWKVLHVVPNYGSALFHETRHVLFSVLLCCILLIYFRFRSQALSRVLQEARLQALRARIRPHFLFNSINAVLGIVRAHPRQAETALHDMADLFRMAMSDARDLVTLRQEIALSRQYIALEQLRMGERLRVNWQIQEGMEDALIPTLLLQPLLENAVYHGIEPLPQGGSINVTLSRSKDELRLSVGNPCTPGGAAQHVGSRMALQNIQERLALLFDVEARYRVESDQCSYHVEIALPYLKEQTI